MPSSPRIPPTSLVLGFGPVAVLPLLAIVAFMLPFPDTWLPLAIAQLWAAAILLFLAGVRRGLSFFTDGGPRPVQIATAVWLFLCGLAGLGLPPLLGFLAMIVGYGSVALLDPKAAQRDEVPRYFATLRPPQMAVAVLGLIALAVRAHQVVPA